jgi:Tol biopolymer transport system component
VAFEALGSAKVMFERIGAGGSFSAVYLVDAAARTSTRIDALDHVAVFGPSISPGGDAIAFLAWTSNLSSDAYYVRAYEVHAADITGRNRKELASFPGNSEGPPSWTPDGSAVVFLVDHDPTSWGIFQQGLTGAAPVTLRTFTQDANDCPALTRSLEHGPISVSVNGGLAYSCHGRQIVVAGRQADPLETRYQPSAFEASVYSPVWSPSGTELAFLEVLHNAGQTSILRTSLKVLDITSGAVRTLAVVQGSGGVEWGTANSFSACWLPGGERLVFNAASTGVTGDEPVQAHLYVVGADGAGLRQLTTARDVFDHSVSCSP